MTRLKAALTRVLGAGRARREAPAGGAQATAARGLERAHLRKTLKAFHGQIEDAQHCAERLLQLERERVHDRAALAGIPRARLFSASIALEGSASERLQVRRLRVGEAVERPFGRFVGVTRCATTSSEVRELWERLLRFERQCDDDVLRGFPSTILDVPGAAASVVDGTLRITPRRQADAGVVAIPRCTYEIATRKIGNFGHWMLDYAPQILALWTVAPEARFLMPQPSRAFQTATLALMGLDPRRMTPWDGSTVECSRLLAFESDGRRGGGRPLSPLMEVRRRLAPSRAHGNPSRRIYVSRRDAPKKRRWIVNEADVEQLFRSRGFEILVMRDCPLDEQVRLFRDARVVAGVNGGGLTDIVFSSSGIDVIVLLSDTLITWYTNGGRSMWAGGERGKNGQLAALGDSPRFWTHVAVAFEQRCHSFVGGDEMPLGALAGFLDDVLAQVERS